MTVKPAEYRELDHNWRLWASIIIVGVLAFSVVFGFLIIPVVQGRAAGLDAFTAICRAVGILPGAPPVRQPLTDSQAAPTTTVAWSPDLVHRLGQPTAGGAEVAQACAACHGERGVSPDPQNPHLAGQSSIAIYKQLHDYKSGSRMHEIMTEIAKAIDDQDIPAVAAYFSSSTAQALDPKSAPFVDAQVVRLVERGDPARGLPACNACHGPNAGGPLETPTLSRQNQAYLARQLQAFRNGERRNDVYTRMRSIAGKLTDREIEALSIFYAAAPK
jgi:cytochrome c553